MKLSIKLALLLFISLLLPALLQAGVTHSVNEENGLQGWRLLEGDVEIELIQRLPDQSRAVLMNHGFSRAVIEQLALSCIFQTVIRNTDASGTGQAVAIDLTRWRMHHAGKRRQILLKEPLLESWDDEDADVAARRMLQWSMFPTRQEFLPHDYNWGQTAYGIPPAAQFDLEVDWEEGGKLRTARFNGLVCAPDVDKLK